MISLEVSIKLIFIYLFYFQDVRTYFWRTSKLFNFGVAKLGAFVYVLFFTSILLVSTGALINNLLKLRRHQKVANLEKNNENKTVQKLKPMRLTTQNVISMTQVVIVATQLLYLICGKSKVFTVKLHCKLILFYQGNRPIKHYVANTFVDCFAF